MQVLWSCNGHGLDWLPDRSNDQKAITVRNSSSWALQTIFRHHLMYHCQRTSARKTPAISSWSCSHVVQVLPKKQQKVTENTRGIHTQGICHASFLHYKLWTWATLGLSVCVGRGPVRLSACASGTEASWACPLGMSWFSVKLSDVVFCVSLSSTYWISQEGDMIRYVAVA